VLTLLYLTNQATLLIIGAILWCQSLSSIIALLMIASSYCAVGVFVPVFEPTYETTDSQSTCRLYFSLSLI